MKSKRIAAGWGIVMQTKSKIDLHHMLNSLGLQKVLPESFIDANYRVLHLDPRQVLFKKGEPVEYVYLVFYGAIRLQNSTDSGLGSVIYFFKKAGNFLGIIPYLQKMPIHVGTAVAIESTSLLEIPIGDFLKEIDQFHPFREEVHHQLALNFKELQYDKDLQREPTPVRLAHFLVRTLDEQKEVSSNSILMKLTKKDLAKKIGSEPETVVRLLSDWGRKGIIKSKNRIIEICDLDELQRISRY